MEKRYVRMHEVEGRNTDMGPALYVKFQAWDGQKLSWREIWEAFAESYPDKWAIEVFPPASMLVDDENIYHLFVLDQRPRGTGICGQRDLSG